MKNCMKSELVIYEPAYEKLVERAYEIDEPADNYPRHGIIYEFDELMRYANELLCYGKRMEKKNYQTIRDLYDYYAKKIY